MGIFDALTGAPARRAAAENAARLNANQVSGTNILQGGQTNSLGALDSAIGAYQPLSALAGQYGQGTDMYLNSLGLNGAAGNEAARAAFQAGPAYEWQLGQGLDALNRRRAAGGMLNSGNADIDAMTYGQGLANQQYNNWQQSLAGLNNNNLAATGAAATGIAGANTNKANVYQNTANNLVNLGNTTTTGLNNNATQGANAQMQASGNILGLGMGLANLAAGGFGGGGLFGSFGSPTMNSNPGNGAGGYAYPVFR